MPSVVRPPHPALRAFVETLWAVDARHTVTEATSHIEHVLPTGMMHVVFRLSPGRLRIYDDTGAPGPALARALVGGARSRFYRREASSGSYSVGAQLRVGAAAPLFGVSALELAERHTALDELWGSQADHLHDSLSRAPTLSAALDRFEMALLKRLPDVLRVDPAVAGALSGADSGPVVIARWVEASGVSHRVFIERFRQAVGLTPKTYCRIQRFQEARSALQHPDASLVSVAGLAGYADQSHFTRDFRQIAGVSPVRVRASGGSNHVVVRAKS
jgi:AraC-like DNA-binding protein